jgi:hypothetical protein
VKRILSALFVTAAAVLATVSLASAGPEDITITSTATYKIDGGYQVVFHFVNDGEAIDLELVSCVVGSDRNGCTPEEVGEIYVAPGASYVGDFTEDIVSRDSAAKGGSVVFLVGGQPRTVAFGRVAH